MGNVGETIRKSLRWDDLVLIPGIVVLFVVVVLNYTEGIGLPPIITSVLLATAIAALVFRFLGGIGSDTTFKMGALKFSGSLAALIGSAFFFNSYLPAQERGSLHEMFSPAPLKWIALERKSATPVTVSVNGFKDVLEIPSESPFVNLPLSIKKGGVIVPEGKRDFTLGVLNESDLADLIHIHEIALKNFVVTDQLRAETGPYDLDPLAYQLFTRHYGGDYSRYTLLDQAGKELLKGQVRGRGAEVLHLNNAFIVVAVVEVRHSEPKEEDNYAKFALGEITLKSAIQFLDEDSSHSGDSDDH